MTNKAQLFRFKVHTGPTIVKQVADAMRTAGLIDLLEGTETVYFTCAGDDATEARTRALVGMARVGVSTFGFNPHRDFIEMGRV